MTVIQIFYDLTCDFISLQQKKQQKDLEVRDKESSKDPKPDVVVHDTLTTTSAPADAPKTKAKKFPWWHRLFGRKKVCLSKLNITNN